MKGLGTLVQSGDCKLDRLQNVKVHIIPVLGSLR